jgi:hypothetical protein
MDRIEKRREYWAASRRVREAFARHELTNVLHWAFGLADEITQGPDDELEDFLYGLEGRLSAVEPAWGPAMEGVRRGPLAEFRRELADGFDKIRTLARNVAAGEPTAMIPLTVQLYVPARYSDRDGLPRWMMRGRLADALVWMAVKLFSEVPRSLIRPCGMTGCPRIYVAAKNQRYCPQHQGEARRQTQRRAERAFRASQRAKKRRKR